MQLPASTGSAQHDHPIIEGLGKHPKHIGKRERLAEQRKKSFRLPIQGLTGVFGAFMGVVDVDGRLTIGTYPNNRVKKLNEIWLIARNEP